MVEQSVGHVQVKNMMFSLYGSFYILAEKGGDL